MSQIRSSSSPTSLLLSISQIQYIFITSDLAYEQSPFLTTAFDLLRELPKDLVQLENAWRFFAVSQQMKLRKGVDLYILPSAAFIGPADDDLAYFESYNKERNIDLVKVFIIDAAIKNHANVAAFLRLIPFGYFHFPITPVNNELHYYDLNRYFQSTQELIDSIKNDLGEINAEMKLQKDLEVATFDFKLNSNTDNLNPFYPTRYAEGNYFILNQMLANFWDKRPGVSSKDRIAYFIGKGAGVQLEQIELIDEFHDNARAKQPITPIEPKRAVMVIVAPFHFPRFEKLFELNTRSETATMLIEASQTEQKINYSYNVDEDVRKYLSASQLTVALEVADKKLNFLDSLAYLHAQFSYSPIFRLPVAGKSFNAELSEIELLDGTDSSLKKIDAIGKLTSERLIHEELKIALKSRNSQLVFISDLPIEWVKLGNYPLCLTHDICRIPQLNYQSLINNYMHNQRDFYLIPPDIIKRTLIIHCAGNDEQDMFELFDQIDVVQTLGVHCVRCNTVIAIHKEVKQYKPDFLIFDCHGDFDEETLSSYLLIDADKNVRLTGDEIMQLKISAPLVFISACNTMPSFGYVKFLTDAFFQAGAFAVTATLLPIDKEYGAALIVRLLQSLYAQENEMKFSNWLSFIAHNIRSSLIYETVAREKYYNPDNGNLDDQVIDRIVNDMLTFEKREKAVEELRSYLKEVTISSDALIEDLELGWLSYTTMGRADLLFFQNWLNKHHLENIGSTYQYQ